LTVRELIAGLMAPSVRQRVTARTRSSLGGFRPDAAGDGKEAVLDEEVTQEKGATTHLALPDPEHAKSAVLNSPFASDHQARFAAVRRIAYEAAGRQAAATELQVSRA
jgi:hypothetical protein